MPRSESMVRLAGTTVSHRGARLLGRADGSQVRTITAVLPPKMSTNELASRVGRLATQLPRDRDYLEGKRFADLCSADAAHIKAIEKFAREYHLEIKSTSLVRRCVVMSGRLDDISAAYRVRMHEYQLGDKRYLSHSGPISIPKRIVGMVQAVLGIDRRPIRTSDAIAVPTEGATLTPPEEVERAYAFPKGADGTGQTIGIVLPGCGLEMDEVKYHFAHTKRPLPQVRVVKVLDGKNTPCSKEDVQVVLDALSGKKPLAPNARQQFERGLNTIESNMDVVLAGTFAPGAKIIVYVAPDSHEGSYQALMRGITDKDHPTVLSCSWSSAENTYAPAVVRTMNTVFQLAALAGVTVCFSSGDDGDGTLWGASKKPIVHFPSSSPFVLACGGTSLHKDGNGFRETGWNEPAGKLRMASGGGFSKVNRQMQWQKGACPPKKGRGVPDVSAKADVKGGYELDAAGLRFTMGGTSAAAPLWAALAALLNQSLGANIGMVGPLLYTEKFRAACRDILKGQNGAYHAGRGWDPVTGWGSPHGEALLQALRGE